MRLARGSALIWRSPVFVSNNVNDWGKNLVSKKMNVPFSTDMKKYLGLPNRVGRKKKRAFQHLKDRLRQKINSWSIRVLSLGGKEVFIKAVLQAIPIYTMACFL